MKEKQNFASGTPQLENARRLTGIYFIEFEVNEIQGDHQECTEKLEVPAAPAMPCERTIAGTGQPVARMMITSQNLRVSWKQRKPRDSVW